MHHFFLSNWFSAGLPEHCIHTECEKRRMKAVATFRGRIDVDIMFDVFADYNLLNNLNKRLIGCKTWKRLLVKEQSV